jgi:hypothetical protein
VRAWLLRVLKTAGKFVLGLLAVILLAPFAIWANQGLDWVLEFVFGRHEAALWNVFFAVLVILFWSAAPLFLLSVITGGINWPWLVRRRAQAAENFYLPATVPLFGRGRTVRFQPRHVLFTTQPWAALGLDVEGMTLRLMSLHGSGDVTVDLRLVQRAVFVRGRMPKGLLDRFWSLRPRRPGLRLFLHARDYSDPIAYTLAAAHSDTESVHRFQRALQTALRSERPAAVPSSFEWGAVLPRYSGAEAFQIEDLWPPKPRYHDAKSAPQ